MKIHILAFVALFVAIGGAVHAETKEELVSKYQGEVYPFPQNDFLCWVCLFLLGRT